MRSNDTIIYEPKGRAREYAPLACNLAVGCVHRCVYCYGPGTFRIDRASWGEVRLKADAVARFDRAAQQIQGDPREILFSFATDPLGTLEQVEQLHQALDVAERYRLRVTVLTKNPAAAKAFAPQFVRNGWRLGVTVCFVDEFLRAEWEPGAPSIRARLEALEWLWTAGVQTWASVEPVVDPVEALRAIRALLEAGVGEIRVGHWNHDPRARQIDWAAFYAQAAALLVGRGHPHLFKADLLAAAGVAEKKA